MEIFYINSFSKINNPVCGRANLTEMEWRMMKAHMKEEMRWATKKWYEHTEREGEERQQQK